MGSLAFQERVKRNRRREIPHLVAQYDEVVISLKDIIYNGFQYAWQLQKRFGKRVEEAVPIPRKRIVGHGLYLMERKLHFRVGRERREQPVQDFPLLPRLGVVYN